LNKDFEIDSIKQLTKEFILKIKESKIYQDFLECQANLNAEPDLKVQVDEFRRQYFEIQVTHKYGIYDNFEQLLNLKNENELLLSNPIVKEYLDAELKLTKLISTIYNQIANEIDFSIDFLEQ